ncbi:chain length determinant protein tyrosine kinase EpsG [Azoarcus olearius]|uniref:Tyrosine-protein kinase n=1 Tax=Azoarcus sp. (strain BH72) TaxID=418699 RepID=A1K7Q2_AZOSB|nr:chain length determinant protein tyrosine kinase EpsG [Azoarcus olearius]ANQ85404.1 tyrosine-protein kinase [Azoarcus olearius]CAL94857.1 tyrosine-protein kinase [Azoarcus olearius]
MNAPHKLPPQPQERPIGAILVESGRLRAEDAERVLRLQRERGLRFGDAARELRLVDDEDVAFALAHQFDYPYVAWGKSAIHDAVVAAYQPFGDAVEALRGLRTQLMLRWLGDPAARRRLAVVSPTRGDGRSWTAANLAVVFSQLGERTLLVDADLRRPAQHRLFGLPNGSGLGTLLAGRSGGESIRRVDGLVNLSVLPAGPQPPNPLELLSRLPFPALLDRLGVQFDVVIIDTPAAEQGADAELIAARAGAACVLARQNASATRPLVQLAERLRAASVNVVGSVLNAY